MMKFIVIGIVIVIVGVAVYLLFGVKQLPLGSSGNNPQTQISKFSPQPEIATDPNFKEVKGQIMEGAPEIPVYPGATLIGSAKTSPDNDPSQGYRIKWTTKDSVPQVMQWYQTELPKMGWKLEKPDDPKNTGEQVVQLSKGNLQGNLVIEGGDGVQQEIVVEIRVIN